MKKLYAVTVMRRVDMAVYADSEGEAEHYACKYADDEVDNGLVEDWDCESPAREVTTLSDIAKKWWPSIPYGEDDDDRTVRQLLKTTAEVVK